MTRTRGRRLSTIVETSLAPLPLVLNTAGFAGRPLVQPINNASPERIIQKRAGFIFVPNASGVPCRAAGGDWKPGTSPALVLVAGSPSVFHADLLRELSQLLLRGCIPDHGLEKFNRLGLSLQLNSEPVDSQSVPLLKHPRRTTLRQLSRRAHIHPVDRIFLPRTTREDMLFRGSGDIVDRYQPDRALCFDGKLNGKLSFSRNKRREAARNSVFRSRHRQSVFQLGDERLIAMDFELALRRERARQTADKQEKS